VAAHADSDDSEDEHQAATTDTLYDRGWNYALCPQYSVGKEAPDAPAAPVPGQWPSAVCAARRRCSLPQWCGCGGHDCRRWQAGSMDDDTGMYVPPAPCSSTGFVRPAPSDAADDLTRFVENVGRLMQASNLSWVEDDLTVVDMVAHACDLLVNLKATCGGGGGGGGGAGAGAGAGGGDIPAWLLTPEALRAVRDLLYVLCSAVDRDDVLVMEDPDRHSPRVLLSVRVHDSASMPPVPWVVKVADGSPDGTLALPPPPCPVARGVVAPRASEILDTLAWALSNLLPAVVREANVVGALVDALLEKYLVLRRRGRDDYEAIEACKSVHEAMAVIDKALAETAGTWALTVDVGTVVFGW
jgi:hypothetical protein